MSTIAPDQMSTASYAPSVAPSSALSVSSLVLGIVSVLGGWTFLAPVAGLVLGILALRREPQARTMALWGIVLNSVMLAGVLLLVPIALVLGLAFLPFSFVL